MKCSFCGQEFNADEAAFACKGCALIQGCKRVKCPKCGYESPAEPGWLKGLIERRKDDK